MDKNKRKQKNIGPLKRYMKNKAKQNTLKAIKYWEKKYNRELSPEERKDLYIKEQKKLMLENKKKFNRIKVGLAAGVLSISSFLAGMQFQKNQPLLPAGISRSETTSQDSNKTKDFRDSLKIDENELHEAKLEETSEIINSLTTPDKVLNYVKSVYATEYNKSHEEQVSAENISFLKQISDFSLYEDTAENGDKIVRYSLSSKDNKEIYGGSLLNISVSKDKENLLSEQVTYWDNEYVNAYSENAEVNEKGTNSFTNHTELGYAINTGLTYYRALFEYTNSSSSSAFEYTKSCKQEFIKALVEQQEKSNSNITQSNEISDNSER